MAKLSLSVLRLRDYRMLMSARCLIMLSSYAQAVIVGWQVYSLTKDVFLLGLAGLAEAVPALACSLLAGHMVDSGSPRRIMNACVGLMALNTLGMTLLGGGFVAVPGGDLVPWIFASLGLTGLARGFFSPSSYGLITLIVPPKEIPATTAWQLFSYQVGATLGPALAGLIYGGYGARGAWIFALLLVGAGFSVTLGIRAKQPARAVVKKSRALDSIAEGWAFVRGSPVLLSVMSLDLLAVLFGGATAMLPAYADQVLHVGSQGLGALRAAPAVGTVATGLAFALWPIKKLSAARLLLAVAGFGVCMVGFGLSTSFLLSMILLTLSGAFDSANIVIRKTLLQVLTPEHMRGRVFSISNIFTISSDEIGAFESGTAARAFGLVPSVVLGGIATLVVAGGVALASPKFRKTVVEA